jgi:hypothetical protein
VRWAPSGGTQRKNNRVIPIESSSAQRFDARSAAISMKAVWQTVLYALDRVR